MTSMALFASCCAQVLHNLVLFRVRAVMFHISGKLFNVSMFVKGVVAAICKQSYTGRAAYTNEIDWRSFHVAQEKCFISAVNCSKYQC